jgi:hypothetical protein
MPTLEKIAFYKHIRNEVPNQQLARDLTNSEDADGINEIAQNLAHKNSNVRSDCLKVLYEIGYLKPFLIKDHVNDFLSLLDAKENRMVWGSFIALATIASLQPDEIWKQIDKLLAKFDHGSVITVVWGIKLFSSLAAANEDYSSRLFPVIINTIETCNPRDVPTHAENILPAINADNKDLVLSLLYSRQEELSPSQLTRHRKVIKKIIAIK